jgi:hypothetical protein
MHTPTPGHAKKLVLHLQAGHPFPVVDGGRDPEFVVHPEHAKAGPKNWVRK